jgi:hypothetical protein
VNAPTIPSSIRPDAGDGRWIDAATRWTATVVLVVYGAGFIILALHDARYGIVEFDLLRTRTVLVGFVFVALVVLAVSAQHYRLGFPALESVINNNDERLQRPRMVVLNTGFVFTALLMAFLFNLFLFAPSTQHHPWWGIFPIAAVLFVVQAIQTYIGKNFSEHPSRSALLSLVGAVALLLFVGIFGSEAISNLAFFFLLAGFASLDLQLATDRVRHALHFWTWVSTIALLAFYVTEIFPTIKPKLGGGTPTPVVLYLTAPVPWLESTEPGALLVDENDQGFYILTNQKGKAFFLPRSNVASVYFGTKAELPEPKNGATTRPVGSLGLIP